jgi:CDP-glycerol glycerophosphotransferase (TagB/SpsB family)
MQQQNNKKYKLNARGRYLPGYFYYPSCKVTRARLLLELPSNSKLDSLRLTFLVHMREKLQKKKKGKYCFQYKSGRGLAPPLGCA